MDDAVRFRALFEATYRDVRGYVHRRGVTHGRADDVVADTFLVAWRRLDEVPRHDPLPWLLAVARNLWRNERRRQARHGEFVRRLATIPPSPAPAAEDPAVAAEDGAVFAALATLPEPDRELLLLVAWEGLTVAGAARVLGCSPGAARVRLHRARGRLARELTARQAGGAGLGADDVEEVEPSHGHP